MKKYDFCGAIICFVLTAVWELVQYSWGMNDKVYALLIFRYVSIVAFGCYMAVGRIKLNKVFLGALFVVGIVWQFFLNYMPIIPPFMNYAWARVNYLSSLFVMPIMYILVKQYGASVIHIPIIKELGKASYNIFLVQMVSYGCGAASIVYRVVPGTVLQLIVIITICCICGYIFYIIENKFTCFVLMKVKQHGYYKDWLVSVSNYVNKIIG